MRSSADIEFASLFVPNTASPQFCDSNHLQCAMNRSRSGDRSALNGVTTGANTPRIRLASISLVGGETIAIGCKPNPQLSTMNYQPASPSAF